MASNPNVRQPNADETKELARRNVINTIQRAVDFLGAQKEAIEKTNADLAKQYGYQMHGLIEAKRWVNYVAFGQVQEEKE